LQSLKQYSIPFTGLKIGHYQFDYDVNRSFFDEFEYSLIKDGKLKVKLDLEKQETLMILDFKIEGEIELNCDKCLADFPNQISVTDRLIAKFSDNEDLGDTEEVMVIKKNEVEIDVSSFIYEVITLAAPYVSVCKEPGELSTCDQDMLKKLNDFLVEQDKNELTDPRWDILKNIKKN